MYTGIELLIVDLIDLAHSNSGFFSELHTLELAGIRSS